MTRVTAIKGGTDHSLKCIGEGSGGGCPMVVIDDIFFEYGVDSNQPDGKTYIYEPTPTQN